MKARRRLSTFFTLLYASLFLAHHGHALIPSEEIHITKLPEETPPSHDVKIKKTYKRMTIF